MKTLSKAMSKRIKHEFFKLFINTKPIDTSRPEQTICPYNQKHVQQDAKCKI